MNKIGPFPVPEPTRSKTGVSHATQSYTISARGARVYDGPVHLHYVDDREVALVSAGIRLSPGNVAMFADRAFYEGVPAFLSAPQPEAVE